MSAGRPGDAAGMRKAVRAILAQVGARPDITGVQDSDSLLSTGVVDSLAMVNLVSALEQQFGIAIGDTDLVPEHFDSVQAIVAFVARKTGG